MSKEPDLIRIEKTYDLYTLARGEQYIGVAFSFKFPLDILFKYHAAGKFRKRRIDVSRLSGGLERKIILRVIDLLDKEANARFMGKGLS